MDRGGWPFFVDGVTCLVNSVSVCEEKREERREKREERRSRDQEKRRDIEMKRNERKDNFFKKHVSRPSDPPDELAQNVSKKKTLSDELFLHFFCKCSGSGRFSLIYMIRIRFFGPGDLIQNYFRAAQ